jgi:putative hydrolase of the HAD superfamily
LLKAILFDLGGTLLTYSTPQLSYWDINRIGVEALYQHLLDGRSLPDEATFCQTLSDNLVADWRAARAAKTSAHVGVSFCRSLQSLGVEVDSVELQAGLWQFYNRVAPYVGIYDDTVEVLEALRDRGLGLGIISNTVWTGDMHDADLRRFGILHLFQHLTYSSEVPHVKPHADIFERTLAAMSVVPEEAVFVGDRIVDDVGGAQAVGMAGVLKEIPGHIRVSETVRPDGRIKTLRELIPWLDDRQG